MSKLRQQPAARKRADDSFNRRYGMSKQEWREFKRTHTPAEIDEKRKKGYQNFIKQA